MQHTVTAEIDAAAEQVWAVLAEVEHWPDWTPTMTSVRRLEAGAAFGQGSAVEVRQPKLSKNVWRVTEFEPGRRFEWATSSPGLTIRADHRITPLDRDGNGNRCSVLLSVDTNGALAGLVGLLYGRTTRRYVDLEAASLKRHCENDRADPRPTS